MTWQKIMVVRLVIHADHKTETNCRMPFEVKLNITSSDMMNGSVVNCNMGLFSFVAGSCFASPHISNVNLALLRFFFFGRDCAYCDSRVKKRTDIDETIPPYRGSLHDQ